MTQANTIQYKPPPTIKRFMKDFLLGTLFYDWIVGPVGSGKTTGIFFKLVYMAKLQKPGRDGIRRTRAVIVRNTMPQLRDTTLSSWGYWFKHGQAGTWHETDKKFVLRFDDVECEVLFRPLDTAQDVARVLSLEVTFAIIDEFVEIPREIIDALSARCGRYPSKVDGGATNWGMWGSSNPSTEDNWWFDYLHNALPDNAMYFLQPSGFSADAENIENLPGGRDYYTAQAKGKKLAWVKQFLEAEWGFSISGQPVVPSFNAELHLAKRPLLFNPLSPLVVGLDPGVANSALIFGQEDYRGRLNVLGECVQQGYGAQRLIREVMKPYMRQRFPDLNPANIRIAPDPAAANRSQSNEKSVVDDFKKAFGTHNVKTETNNRFPLRLNAIEHYTCRLIDGEPALQIDAKQCPTLVRALKGGWRYVLDTKRETSKPEPDKNAWSHPGDAYGYLCRYFHRQEERGMGVNSSTPRFTPPRSFGPTYHQR